MKLVDRRHAALPGEVDDTLPIEIGQRVRDHQDRIRTVGIHRGKGRLELVGGPHPERLHADAELLRRFGRRAIAQRHAEVVLVPQHGDLTKIGQKLFQQAEALRRKLRRVV